MRKLFVILAVVLAFTAALSLRQVNAGAGTRQPQKWALMVGVNDYVAERIPDLRGCRNDVELMKSVLVQKYAFPENHIRLLFDRDATKERILAEMDNWLVKQAKPGDVVVFHFSGHGSQAPNDNPNEDPEEDRLDETICPSDIRTDRAFRDVRDDELGAVLAKLSQTHLTVILDCCHSGTGTRALGEIDDLVSPFKIPADADGKPLTTLTRYIYRPEMFDGQQEAPASENSIAGMLSADLFQQPGSRAAGEPGSRAADDQLPYTLATGCAADQTSADAPFPLQASKYYYFGALTYNLAGALMQGNPDDPQWTYERLVATARETLKRRGFKQDPQLEGIRDRRVFWPGAVSQPQQPQQQATPQPPPTPAKPFVLVTKVGGDRVELAAGSAAGVTEKSVYTIYPADDYKLEGPGIALAQVTYTGPAASIATLKRADAARLKAGCRAVETLHFYPPNRLYVTVAGVTGDAKTAIETALKKVPFVSVVNGETNYTDRVLRVQPAGQTLKAWLVNTDGRRFLEHTAANAEALVTALRRDLNNAFIIKRLTLLDNPSAPFKVKVWVDGQPQRMEGEKIVFKFQADRDCYLNLIDCGTSGQVTVLFPNAYHRDNRIQAGKVYSIPSAEMGFDIETQGPTGRELVKAIATLRPLNLLGFDFNTLTKEENAGFLTRTLDQSASDPARMEQAMARSLGGSLEEETGRSKDFKVVARPPAQPAPAPTVAATPVSASPAQQQQPSVVAAQPVKPPVQQTPVQVTPETIPTAGWATDAVIVDIKSKGV
ncbi:MAG: DUF4384 domain-containing protein [Armatimonadetes bacterium]|nr:DUF4384 domain-containing protein [Armatimonadota bacterium]